MHHLGANSIRGWMRWLLVVAAVVGAGQLVRGQPPSAVTTSNEQTADNEPTTGAGTTETDGAREDSTADKGAAKAKAADDEKAKADEKAKEADDTDEPNPVADWIAAQFPARFHRVTFLLPDYQWLCLLVVIAAGFVADQITRFILGRISATVARYAGEGEVLATEPKLWRPVGLLVNAMVWYIGTEAIGLPAFFSNILLVGLKLFAVVAAMWTAFLMINLLAAYLAKRAERTYTKFDDLLVPLMSKSLKVLVICMGLLSAADALNLPIAGLVGGLGLGGLALAMASKDAVSNLFGSVTVLADRPFEVGDWIVLTGAEGSVEEIGFRSTRIRTFYNSQITLPNSLLTTAVVDNMGRRRYRRIKTTLGVQYDTTPEQIDAFCEGIRELLRRHPYSRKDYYHVYFNGFGASSLDILLYCFLECPDWSIELRETHRLYSEILRLAKRLGVQFAFPTRTLHMFQEAMPAALPAIDEPARVGQKYAAELAGPLLGPKERPGGVEFGGPTEIE